MLAKDRALAAAAHHNPTPNPQLLLIVVFLHHPTCHHERLYPLRLKIMPDFGAEQHSGNRRRIQQCIEVDPPNKRALTKEEGGVALLGRGTMAVMLATASLSLTAGGWPPSMLAELLRLLPSAAAAAALGMLMHVCWHKSGAGRGGCGRGGYKGTHTFSNFPMSGVNFPHFSKCGKCELTQRSVGKCG